jgi:hypothetical protein
MVTFVLIVSKMKIHDTYLEKLDMMSKHSQLSNRFWIGLCALGRPQWDMKNPKKDTCP